MPEEKMLPAVRTEREGALARPEQPQEMMAVAEVERQMNAVHRLMGKVMVKGVDYDVIPGTEKPSLLQPGAEKLGVMFRIAPSYEVKETALPNGHREYQSYCKLVNITTGQFLGEAYGLCSTMETRYRWRQKKRTCPHCAQETIIKGQERYGGGWLCWKKKDGCGAKFPDGDPVIEGQEVGREENTDIADCHHTALAISQKRSYVRAVRNATAASAIFTDSTEDLVQGPPPQQEPGLPPQSRRSQEADDFFENDLREHAGGSPPTQNFEDRRRALFGRIRALGYRSRGEVDKLAQDNKIEPKPIERYTPADITILENAVERLEVADAEQASDLSGGPHPG